MDVQVVAQNTPQSRNVKTKSISMLWKGLTRIKRYHQFEEEGFAKAQKGETLEHTMEKK